MRTKVFGTAVFAAMATGAAVALRRFGPGLAERGMNKCHEMMGHLAEECPPKRAAQEEGREDSEAGQRWRRAEETGAGGDNLLVG